MGNIDLTGKLSLSDALSVGMQTTVTGLLIVFAVLIILMLVLVAMKYIFAGKNEKKEPVQNNVSKKVSENLEDEELLAVISAAVAAQEEEELIAILTAAAAASLNTSTYNLKIKSYRRIGNNAPAWNKAGLTDVIGSRY